MSVVRKLALGLLVCAAASAQAATQSVAATSQTTQATAPAATSSSSASTPAAATTTTTTTTKSTSSKTSAATTQKVNINTADEATLAKVRGVGAANAKAIIAYRDNSTDPHQFASVNDLAKVPGVKISAYELKVLAAKRLTVG